MNIHIVLFGFINIYINIHAYVYKGTHSPFYRIGPCFNSNREKEEKNRFLRFKIFENILLYLIS